jgi:hypothetical protein
VFQVVANTESILDSTKKALGVGADYDVFDADIIMYINSVFVNLQQLGIGPAEGFAIEDANTTWDAFLGTQQLLNQVKSYVVFKVRLAFDPPPSSFHIGSLEKQIQELEWRMSVVREEMGTTVTVLDPTVMDTTTSEPTLIEGGGAEGI